ncbi:MAG: PilZ domain-containing protein [Thermoanaerobaculia bacterium]
MRMPSIWAAWRAGRERRREARQAVPGLTVESPAVEVDLVDASGTGLGILTKRPLRIGVIYPFRLRRDGQVSEVYGLVRWCEAAKTGRFRAGVSVGKTIGPALSTIAP